MPLRPVRPPREPRSLRGAHVREPLDPPPDKLPPKKSYVHPSGTNLGQREDKRAPEYLDFIRARPCHACGAPGPSQAAHFAPRGDGGGMATKADDFRTVPQCARCHAYWHQHGVLGIFARDGSVSDFRTRAESEADMLREQVRCLVAYLRILRTSF